MGCGSSRSPPQNGFQLNDKRAIFRPPPGPGDENEMKRFFSPKDLFASKNSVPSSKRPEPIPPDYSSQNRAKEVAKCASLLRDMYTLDLEIWAMTDAHTDINPDREIKERKADALFTEIRRMVESWKASGNSSWGPEEWKDIKEICDVFESHGTSRY